MKRVVAFLVIVCLVSVGTLISRAAGESPGAAKPSPASAEGSFVGKEVRVYFRQEAAPGRPIEWRRGVVAHADDRFITLSMSEGETLWIPMASVAYLESAKGATTKPS